MRPIDRLTQEADRRGWTRAGLARHLGISQQRLHNWSTRDVPSHSHADVARKMGWTVDELLNGLSVLAGQEQGPGVCDAHAPVPMLDVRVSAGSGEIRPEDDPIVGSMRLNTLWVRRHLPSITSITNLVTIIAHGRSMEPTFCDGSILLVDQGVNEIRVDGIYVLSFNDELYVKRVTRRLPDGALLVSSDNPLHQGFTIENGSRDSVQVLGRVVWSFDSKGV